MTSKVMLVAVLAAALCSCGNSSQSAPAGRLPDNPLIALRVPESGPTDDPDPTMRFVAKDAPCFPSDGGKTYRTAFDNISLVRRLARDNDQAALTTLEAKGVFVMLSPGTRFQTRERNEPFPYQYGDVRSKGFIGTHCVIESINLIKRKDAPREVSVEEEAAAYEKNNARIDAILRKNGF